MATLTVYPSGFNSTLSKYAAVSHNTIETAYHSAYDGSGLNSAKGVYFDFTTSYVARCVYTFNLSALPENAIINSVQCIATGYTYVNNGDYSYSSTVSSSVALGYINGNTFSTVTSTSLKENGKYANHTLSGGSWTVDSLKKCAIRLSMSTSYTYYDTFYLAFAGATLTVDYSLPPEFSGYANIGGTNKELTGGYVNVNGSWKEISDMYMNVNGIWKPMA